MKSYVRLMLVVIVAVLVSYSACAGIDYNGGQRSVDYVGQGQTGDMLFKALIEKTNASRETAYKNAWSGTMDDLHAVVERAKNQYGFENSKHLGRNATMLAPASLKDMERELVGDNSLQWKWNPWDGWHSPEAQKEDGWLKAGYNSINSGVKKYKNKFGGEAVYDEITGKIVADQHMGTKNFSDSNGVSHGKSDVKPHQANDQYKYIGILYERNPNDPNKYYIIDGQTGVPMDAKQVAEFPTTLSNMWKDMGLVCVKNDAEDIVPPKDGSRNNATTGTSKTTIEEGQAKNDPAREGHPETLSNTNIVSQMSMSDTDAQVGVRGWCECGDNHGKLYEAGTMYGRLIMTGILNFFGGVKGSASVKHLDGDAADKMIFDTRYTYILCGKCGKCRRPSRDPDTVEWDQIDWNDEWVIMDCILEFQLQDAKDLSTAQSVRARLVPQKDFLSKFANGGVVFPGACACKVPDPIHVGFLESGYSPYVCLLCGRVRLPDEVGNMPNGPTALEEMGLNEKAEQEERRIVEWLASLTQSTRD